MSRVKQNIIILQEKSFEPYDISLYAGNMYMNRFCINEEAGFELSGVYRLKEAYKQLRYHTIPNGRFEPSYGDMTHHSNDPTNGDIPLEDILLEDILLEDIPQEDIPLEDILEEDIPQEDIPLEDILEEDIPQDSNHPSSRYMTYASNEPSYNINMMTHTINMMTYRQINNDIESCYARFVSFDSQNQNNVSQKEKLSHVTQNDMDQGDMSREEHVLYGLAKQERKEKGNDLIC